MIVAGILLTLYAFFHDLGLIGCVTKHHITHDRLSGCVPLCYHIHRLHSIHFLPPTNHSNLPLLKVSEVTIFVVVVVCVYVCMYRSINSCHAFVGYSMQETAPVRPWPAVAQPVFCSAGPLHLLHPCHP